MGEIKNEAYTRVQISDCGGMVERYFAEYAFVTIVAFIITCSYWESVFC
jgi:hypothetical protein